jgi:hypothetical protein
MKDMKSDSYGNEEARQNPDNLNQTDTSRLVAHREKVLLDESVQDSR